MPSNLAAWLTAAKARPLKVEPAPYSPPGPNEVVVKNGAVAVNPVDWGIQALAFRPLDYPTVLGSDVAGEVVEVGSCCSRLKIGDRVLGMALGLSSERTQEGAFQIYTILLEDMTTGIPDGLPFEKAATLPLAVYTSTAALFQKDYLGLELPSTKPKAKGKTIVIWGGSSSVGSNAIQLAVAAGYEVFTTASPKNFDYVKKLGASQVFDYKDETVVNQLVDALKGKSMPGIVDAIGEQATIGFHGALQRCIEVASETDAVKFVATAQYVPENLSSGDVNVKFISGMNLKNNGIGKAVFADFLPKALAKGSFRAAPEPEVVGHGLENIQGGIDAWKNGVSAKKIVVSL